MAETPPGMLTLDRVADHNFQDDERLYRRFSPDDLLDGEISTDAVELPDMSLIRQKHGKPEWLLLDDDVADWGVFFFCVGNIPPGEEIVQHHQKFRLEPRHVPTKYNYPHSEIWAFNDNVHIVRGDKNNPGNLHLLDPDFHLRWRERIVESSHIVIRPKE